MIKNGLFPYLAGAYLLRKAVLENDKTIFDYYYLPTVYQTGKVAQETLHGWKKHIIGSSL